MLVGREVGDERVGFNRFTSPDIRPFMTQFPEQVGESRASQRMRAPVEGISPEPSAFLRELVESRRVASRVEFDARSEDTPLESSLLRLSGQHVVNGKL